MAMKMEKSLARIGIGFIAIPVLIAIWVSGMYLGLKMMIWALRLAGADI